MLENITIEGSNVTAEIDAFINYCKFGKDGVFYFGEKLRHEIASNNLIKIYDGLFLNQGRFARVKSGTYEEIKIANGKVDTIRYDLIVSHFETDGINELHDIRVLQGDFDGEIPQPTISNTFEGGTVNELPLYLVKLNGINIESITPQFNLILSIQDMLDAIIGIVKAGVYIDSYDIKELMKKLDINQ